GGLPACRFTASLPRTCLAPLHLCSPLSETLSETLSKRVPVDKVSDKVSDKEAEPQHGAGKCPPGSLLRHRRTRARVVKGQDVGWVPLAGFSGGMALLRKNRAVQPVRGLPRFNFLDEIGDTLQNARRLVNVIAHDLELRRAGQYEERLHPRLHGAANVGL